MTVEQALARLLAGTPARFVRVGPSSYRIVRAQQPRSRRDAPVERPARPDPAPVADEETIVVTASKRPVRLRDYPGPVTIVRTSELPLSAASEGTDALTRHVAALGSTHLGPGRDKLFIRAIADSSFSGQTQATVGQYLGEARLNYNAPDPNLRLYDMNSVELLPGPQGTLYGAGTIGGVLRAAPNAPDLDLPSAGVRVSGALTQHGSPSSELAGVLNLPLAQESAAVRLVGYSLSEGGYIDDVGRGEDDVNRTTITGGRGALRVQLTDNVEIHLTGAAQRIDARDSQYAEKGEGPLERSSVVAQPFRNSFTLGNMLLERSAGAYRLTITGTIANNSLSEVFDASPDPDQPAIFRQRNHARLAAGEARLSRDNEDGSGWLAGMSLVHNERRLERASGWPDELVEGPVLRNEIAEQTLFGEFGLPLKPGVKLTMGARLTHVRSEGRLEDEPVPLPNAGHRSTAAEWQFLPSAGLSAELNDKSTFYARYQEGFRPGGVILVAGQSQRLDSDHVAALETGIRFRSIGAVALRGGVAASYTRWRNVQADLIDNAGFPSTTNLGDGNVWTLDTQLQAEPAAGLKIQLAGVFNHSEVTNHDPGIIIIDGDPLPNVPRFSGRLGLDYSRQLSAKSDLRLLGWARYVGRSRLGIGPNLGRDQGNYFDTGVEVQFGLGPLHTYLTVTNLLGAVGNRFALGSLPSFGLQEQTTPMRPRTVRVGVGTAF